MRKVKSASELHKKAEEAREKAHHLQALKLLDEAIILYQEEKNYNGICGALQSQVLTFKHLYFLTHAKIYAILAQKSAEASLEIARMYDLKTKLGSCYFRLGETAMIFKNYKKAIEWYKTALTNYQGSFSEKGDYRYHLGEAFYRNGQKELGLKTIFQGLTEIEKGKNTVDPFLFHVWQSGVHMKLADLLQKDNPQEAKKHLKVAQEIATSDKKLIIRKRQVKELAKKFNK